MIILGEINIEGLQLEQIASRKPSSTQIMTLPAYGGGFRSRTFTSVLGDLAAVIGMGHTIYLDFNPELKKLEKVLTRVQDVLGDRERRLGEKRVDKWINDLKDVLYVIDDLLDQIKDFSKSTVPDINPRCHL